MDLLNEINKKVATALADRGVKKDEVIAIFSPNIPEYAIALHGAIRAGL